MNQSTSPASDTMAFASEADQPVRYMERTRAWYLALGFDNPYRWAHYLDVPFTALEGSLANSVVTLITTASPYDPSKGDQGPGAAYNAQAKFYEVYSGSTAQDHDLRIAHVAIDRKHTAMTDPNSWFPLPLMRQMQAQGRIGRLAPRFHGAPTNRSQRHTLEIDCPQILARCREDGVQAAVLVANCPVCHQTLSLVARHLEANGISTVLMGCAKDIPEYCGVPRFLFSDFPLGNAAGKPHDPESQRQTLLLALRLLDTAPVARTTIQSPQRWSSDPDWKLDYSNPERAEPGELQRLRAEADQAKAEIARLKSSLPS
jgi:D-proline reductase (dithiol) PrdB